MITYLGPYNVGFTTGFQGAASSQDATAQTCSLLALGAGSRAGVVQVICVASDPQNAGAYALLFAQLLVSRSDDGTETLTLLSGPPAWIFFPGVSSISGMAAPQITLVAGQLDFTFSGVAGVDMQYSFTAQTLGGGLFPQ